MKRITERTSLLSSQERNKDYDSDSQQQYRHHYPLIERNSITLPVIPPVKPPSSYNSNPLTRDKYSSEIELKSNISIDEFAIYHDLHQPLRVNTDGGGYLQENLSTKSLRTGRQRKKTASRTKGNG